LLAVVRIHHLHVGLIFLNLFFISIFKIDVFPLFVLFFISFFEVLLQGEVLVGFGEVIELLVLTFILWVHEAVLLVDHVLLAPSVVLERLVAVQTQVPQVYPLCQIRQQPFEVDDAVDFEDEEGVGQAHVVQALLHSLMLLVAEQADPQGLQRCRLLVLALVQVFLVGFYLVERLLLVHIFQDVLVLFLLIIPIRLLVLPSGILIYSNALEHGGFEVFNGFAVVLADEELLVLLVVLGLLVLIQLLHRLEHLLASITLPVRSLTYRAGVHRLHHCSLLVKDFFSHWLQRGHPPLGVIHMKF